MKADWSSSLFRPNRGKRIDILMPIEEGERYKLGSITFTGNQHINNLKALRGTFAIKDGDWFNATLVGKGLNKKAYGQLDISTSAPFPSPSTTTRRKPSRSRLTSTKARFTSRASSFKATSSPATAATIRRELLDEGQTRDPAGGRPAAAPQPVMKADAPCSIRLREN